MVVLKGKRVTLRKVRMQDAKAIAKLANNREVAKFARMPYPYKLKDAKKFIKESNEKWKNKTGYSFAIISNETKHYMGGSGIKIRSIDKSCEIGYWLGKPYWKKGYMTEACNLMLDYCFNKLKLNRVEIGASVKNTRSNRLIKRLGAKHEGRLRDRILLQGKFHDANIYSILKKEFKKRGKK